MSLNDFERLVADKLVGLLLAQQGEDSPNPENWDSGYANHLANYLAPRVAAAMAAAHGTQGPKAREILRMDALAALKIAP